ncbi:MAG: hypothetical protein ACI4Q6_06810 [Huintestinicola sp.]
MADRLSIGTQYKDLIEDFDRVDLLNMKTNGERADIFMITLALGVNKGERTPSKAKLGFILESVARGKDSLMSYIYSVAVDELRKSGQENQITDTNVVYGIAEEYANTGFEIIKQMIPNFDKYDEEEFMFAMIEMMDELIS